MSDLHELPDLAREVSERVVVPPYDEVSRRVRTRRLRGATGSIAAAVLVIGGVALWQSVAPTAGPSFDPADPTVETPLPATDEAMWRKVVDGTDSHPVETVGTDDGAIAVVWRALEQPEPTFALVIREVDGTVHGRRLDEPIDLTPAPGGWVGVSTARGWFIGSDGSITDLGMPGEARSSRPGDVLISNAYGLWAFSPADRRWSSVHFDGIANDIWLAEDGTTFTCALEGDHIVLRRDAREITAVPGDTCVLAGRGSTIAVVGLGDEPDGSIPMTGLAFWDDGNLVLPRITSMLGGVTSVVVMPSGSTLITDASTGESLAFGGDFEDLGPVGEAFVAGDRLYVTSYGLMNGPISWSDDDGRTWHEDVLPGNDAGNESNDE